MPGCASWLLAAPQTIVARSTSTHLVAERAAEGAGRVDVDLGVATSASVSATTVTCGCSLADPLDRRRVDVGDDDAGAVLDEVADQVAPDLADAGDADGAARRGWARPTPCSAAARMPWKTPYAVSTEESPAPPWATVRPVTKSHSRAMTSMSSLNVPTSHAVK